MQNETRFGRLMARSEAGDDVAYHQARQMIRSGTLFNGRPRLGKHKHVGSTIRTGDGNVLFMDSWSMLVLNVRRRLEILAG